VRAFLAIDLPEPVLEALETLQDDLRVGRIMDPGTLHLTLAFLGEQPESMIAEVHQALTGLDTFTFDLTVQGLGTFGSRQPAVLWAGIAPQPALTALRDRVRRLVRGAGLELQRERFRPHVTLARIRRGLRHGELVELQRFLTDHAAFAVEPFQVDRVTLFQSILSPDGARHEVLAEYPLRHAG